MVWSMNLNDCNNSGSDTSTPLSMSKESSANDSILIDPSNGTNIYEFDNYEVTTSQD